MKNLFHSLWGVSRLLVGGMTIALASCTQDSGLLDDFSEASESSVLSRSISVADSVSLFSNADEYQQLYLQLIIPQYFISNKSGIWSLSLIVHSKG